MERDLERFSMFVRAVFISCDGEYFKINRFIKSYLKVFFFYSLLQIIKISIWSKKSVPNSKHRKRSNLPFSKKWNHMQTLLKSNCSVGHATNQFHTSVQINGYRMQRRCFSKWYQTNQQKTEAKIRVISHPAVRDLWA